MISCQASATAPGQRSRSTSFDCLGSNCPLYTECFAELARNNAAEADIVVTNHALLAIDAFGDNTVLPEHDVIIIDEAHELKDRVTNALSGQINTSMSSAATSSVRKHTIVQDKSMVALLDSAGRSARTRPERCQRRSDPQHERGTVPRAGSDP